MAGRLNTMIHKHHFVTVLDQGIDRQRGMYVRVVCVEPACAEVRDVYSEGAVRVIKEGLPDHEE